MKKGLLRGFTVIELMVVVAIIAVLVAIIAAIVIQEITKTKIARAKADIDVLGKMMIVARGNAGIPIMHIIGNNWPAYPCVEPRHDIRNVDESDPCYTNWISALTILANTAGDEFKATKELKRDPWGSPYLLHGGEDWVGYGCNNDLLGTNGPNGLPYDEDDYFIQIQRINPCP